MKIRFILLITSLSWISFSASFGQDIVLKGKVIDQKTNAAIAYSVAEIMALKTGAYSDSTGKFVISVPEKNIGDSIEFYSLGYERKKFRISDLTKVEGNVIELKPTYVNLNEIVVIPREVKTVRLGITSKKPERCEISTIFGGQNGQFIPNKDKELGFVKAVSFYITKIGCPNAPFRVRIYGRDKQTDGPGADLLDKNVIVSNNKGAGWFTVDISKYGIDFPKDGMFVMMELVYSGDQYYFDLKRTLTSEDGKPEKKIKLHLYGQSLGKVNKQPESGNWARGLGDKWYQSNRYHKGYVNVMINADIDFPVK
jgi:hypothetical protein